MTTVGRNRTLVLGVVALAGCGAPKVPAGAPVHRAVASRSTPVPAYWRYHSRSLAVDAAEITARTAVDPTLDVVCDLRGHRWLEGPDGQRRAAAVDLAREPLIAAAHAANGWVFADPYGTLYRTDSPLGPWVDARMPERARRLTTTSGNTLLAIDADGGLVSSADGGSTWTAEVMPGMPATTRFIDVRSRADGAVLALAVPERLWLRSSSTSGWQALPVDAVGVRALRGSDGGWLLSGTFDDYTLDARGKLAPRPPATLALPVTDAERHALAVQEIGQRAKRRFGPSADALRAHRALLSGDRYIELEPVALGDAWMWLEGSAVGILHGREIPELAGCRTVQLAAFDRWVTVVCSADGPSGWGASRFRVWRSDDRGAHFRPEPYAFSAHAPELELAMGAAGTLIVAGKCTPVYFPCDARALARRGAPTADDVRRAAKLRDGRRRRSLAPPIPMPARGTTSAPAPAPPAIDLIDADESLAGARGLTFSRDGQRAYAIMAPRSGSARVIASHDGGKSFASVPIPDWPQELQHLTSSVTASPEDDAGHIAFTIDADRRTWILVIDAGGRVIARGTPPAPETSIGALGLHVLAVSRRAEAWESPDGGATWSRVVAPLSVRELPDRSPAIACGPTVCTVGDWISRVGWGAPPPEDTTPPVVSPPRRADSAGTLECVARDRLLPLVGTGEMPDIARAPIGDSVWVAAANVGRRGVHAWVGLRRSTVAQNAGKPPADDRPANPDFGSRTVSYELDGNSVPFDPSRSWIGGLSMRLPGAPDTTVYLARDQLVRATRTDTGWTLSTRTVAALDTYRLGVRQIVEFALLRGGPALHVERTTDASFGLLYPIRATGSLFDDPIVVPTQRDVLHARACTSRERARGWRLVSLPAGAARYDVVVAGGPMALRTLTERAVLQGSIDEPCISAVETGDAMGERVILPWDDLEHAWRFRRSVGNTIVYQSLRCSLTTS